MGRGRQAWPVVRKAVSANPGLKVKLCFDLSCIKAYIRANILWIFILVKGKVKLSVKLYN